MKSTAITLITFLLLCSAATASIGIGVIKTVQPHRQGATFLVMSDGPIAHVRMFVNTNRDTKLFQNDGTTSAPLGAFTVGKTVTYTYTEAYANAGAPMVTATAMYLGEYFDLGIPANAYRYRTLEGQLVQHQPPMIDVETANGVMRLRINDGTAVFLAGQHKTTVDAIPEGSNIRAFYLCVPQPGIGHLKGLIPATDIIIAD